MKDYGEVEQNVEQLENELEELKTKRRKEISEKIKVALSFGDLSENSEYDEAKNEQAIVEARIMSIEAMLKNVKVIDEGKINTKIVNVGSKVKVNDLTYNEIVEYKIVGSNEADPLEGKISDESPVGAGLLKHEVGDVVEIEVPAGIAKYEILEISR